MLMPNGAWWPLNPATGLPPKHVVEYMKANPTCNPKKSYRCGKACRSFSQRCTIPGFEYEPPDDKKKKNKASTNTGITFPPRTLGKLIKLDKKLSSARGETARKKITAEFNFAFQAAVQGMTTREAKEALRDLQMRMRRTNQQFEEAVPDSINSAVI